MDLRTAELVTGILFSPHTGTYVSMDMLYTHTYILYMIYMYEYGKFTYRTACELYHRIYAAISGKF